MHRSKMSSQCCAPNSKDGITELFTFVGVVQCCKAQRYIRVVFAVLGRACSNPIYRSVLPTNVVLAVKASEIKSMTERCDQGRSLVIVSVQFYDTVISNDMQRKSIRIRTVRDRRVYISCTCI